MIKGKLLEDDVQQNDPRQIFVGWVSEIKRNAVLGKNQLEYAIATWKKEEKRNHIDCASDQFGAIIGACDAILTVIKGGGS